MPLPQFNVLNYPQAISQGNTLAAQEQQIQQAAQLNPLKVQAAQQTLQNQQLINKINQLKQIKDMAAMTSDQASWDQLRNTAIQENPQAGNMLPQKFDPAFRDRWIYGINQKLQSMPASVQTYQYYQNLPGAPAPSAQNFLDVTRPVQKLNLGGEQVVIPGSGQMQGSQGRNISMPVTLKPSEQIGYKGKAAEASSKGQVKGKFEQTLENNFPKAQSQIEQQNLQWDNMEKLATDALNQVNSFTTGPAGNLKWISGSVPKDLSENLKALGANVGFDALSAMRNASPTGGALGSVSDVEGELLRSVKGSLNQGQSPSQLRKSLKNILNMTARLRKITNNQYNTQYKGLLKQPFSWNSQQNVNNPHQDILNQADKIISGTP